VATKKSNEPSLTDLVGGVVGDLERLVGQHFTLLRSEVKEDLENARDAALSFGVGAGLLAGSGVLATLAVVHGLHRLTRLPLWACYGALAGLTGSVGAQLLMNAREEAARVQGGPARTVKTLKEDLSWLKNEATQALT